MGERDAVFVVETRVKELVMMMGGSGWELCEMTRREGQAGVLQGQRNGKKTVPARNKLCG